MLIAGFQKNSFVDYPGKIAAVVFTPYCNMRCWYCHNRHILGEGAPDLDPRAILDFLSRRRGQLDAVVISGGEPTLRPDLAPFIDAVRDLGYLVKLDTNGTNPLVVADLLSAGKLDYVAMDIKAPLDRYSSITRTDDDISAIRRSIALLINSGVPCEFRTTFSPDLSPADVGEIARELTGAPRYFIQPYRPRDAADPPAHTTEELRDALAQAREHLGDRAQARSL